WTIELLLNMSTTVLTFRSQRVISASQRFLQRGSWTSNVRCTCQKCPVLFLHWTSDVRCTFSQFHGKRQTGWRPMLVSIPAIDLVPHELIPVAAGILI